MNLNYSKEESTSFGLKIGRIYDDPADVDISGLREQITAEEYDLVRWKRPISDDHAFDSLHRLGLPWHYGYAILHYRIDFLKYPLNNDGDGDFTFSMYTIEEKDELLPLIKQIFNEDPLGYFRDPILGKIITREAEIDYLARYFADGFITDDKTLYLLYEGHEIRGFIAMEIKENTLYVPASGVLPSYRNGTYFKVLRAFARKFCQDHDIRYGVGGARINNLYSQMAFHKDGMVPYRNDAVVYILPLLGRSVSASVSGESGLALLSDDIPGMSRLKSESYYISDGDIESAICKNPVWEEGYKIRQCCTYGSDSKIRSIHRVTWLA